MDEEKCCQIENQAQGFMSSLRSRFGMSQTFLPFPWTRDNPDRQEPKTVDTTLEPWCRGLLSDPLIVGLRLSDQSRDRPFSYPLRYALGFLCLTPSASLRLMTRIIRDNPQAMETGFAMTPKRDDYPIVCREAFAKWLFDPCGRTSRSLLSSSRASSFSWELHSIPLLVGNLDGRTPVGSLRSTPCDDACMGRQQSRLGERFLDAASILSSRIGAMLDDGGSPPDIPAWTWAEIRTSTSPSSTVHEEDVDRLNRAVFANHEAHLIGRHATVSPDHNADRPRDDRGRRI